jgi:hypothetical protein
MLKAVPDVNVYVSSLIKQDGHAAQIFRRADEFMPCTSEPILNDLKRVLHYARIQKRIRLTEKWIMNYLVELRWTHFVLAGKLEVSIVHDDPDDDKIVACALEVGAAYIISGDPHLLNLKHYRSIQIITPKAFLKVLDLEKTKS